MRRLEAWVAPELTAGKTAVDGVTVKTNLGRLLRLLRAVRPRTIFITLVFLAALLTMSCGSSGNAGTSPNSNPTASTKSPAVPPPHVVAVETTDSAINMAETIEGGWVTLELKNTGTTPHMIQVRKATSMQDAERLLALERDPAITRTALDTAAAHIGGISPLASGTSARVTLNLPPGIYNVADNVPSAGVPNFRKGLARTLTVTAANGPAAQEPVATATMTMKDNSYGSFPVLPAGQSTIKFLNDGPEAHTAIIGRLVPGVTVSDAFQRLVAISAGTVERGSGPLWEVLGGLEGSGKGLTAYVTINLQAGAYIFFCGLPDPATGKTHAALGMVSGFTVS